MTITEKLLPKEIYFTDPNTHDTITYTRADLTPVSAEDLEKVRDTLTDADAYSDSYKLHLKIVAALKILDRIAKVVG